MPDCCPSALSTSAEDPPKPSLTSATVARDPDRTEQRVLEEISHLSYDADKSSHKRYLSCSNSHNGGTPSWPTPSTIYVAR